MSNRMKSKKPLRPRKRVNQQIEQELAAALRDSGLPYGFVSVGSRVRPPDWRENVGVQKPSGPVLTLYHFTSRIHLPILMKWGIQKGDVCIDPSDEGKNYNAPWLTNDPDWETQAWAVDPETGRASSVFDKREVRLTVEISEADPALNHWPDLAKKLKVEDFWYNALNSVGGRGECHYVYHGRIPMEWVTTIDYRDVDAGRVGWGLDVAPLRRNPPR